MLPSIMHNAMPNHSSNQNGLHQQIDTARLVLLRPKIHRILLCLKDERATMEVWQTVWTMMYQAEFLDDSQIESQLSKPNYQNLTHTYVFRHGY